MARTQFLMSKLLQVVAGVVLDKTMVSMGLLVGAVVAMPRTVGVLGL